MNSIEPFTRHSVPRREFLAFAGAATLLPLLAACTTGTATATATAGKLPTGVLKFWDSLLGTGQQNTEAKTLLEAYKDGGLTAAYQVIPAANLFQTFQASIAAATGPAVSGGYAFQAFQFDNEGAIAYADNLFERMKKDGTYADFLPGVVAPFKTAKGYVAVPWGLDMRVLWYRKSLLEQVGADVPTDWDSFITAGKALAKAGKFGWATAAGTGASYGGHGLVSLMINNGGGLFDEEGKPDATYSRNVEAMDFVREMYSAGMIDPASVSYSTQNLYDQWKNGGAGMGITNPTLPTEAGDSTGDILAMSPLAGPHGNKGTLEYVKNYMMYTNTPSQTGSEDLMLWWLKQFKGSKGFFAQGVTGALPVFKSVAKLPEFASNSNTAKILKEWQPIGKGYSARGTTLFGGLASVDAGTAVNQFAQTMLAGQTDSKTALKALQAGIVSVLS
jgi:multiple sugar transport system substrate-binding protein